MKSKYNIRIAKIFFLKLIIGCLFISSHVNAQFKATGYSSIESIPDRSFGNTVVTFDTNQVKGATLSYLEYGEYFNQPAGTRLNFGYLETYDPERLNGDAWTSWEIASDESSAYYNRNWIESQNPARIKVKFIGALSLGKKIAHVDNWSGSPWGPQYLDDFLDSEAPAWGYGDWAEETYYIYPDAIHTRYSKVYTAHSVGAIAFGGHREPPNYNFEFFELWVDVVGGKRPNEIVEGTKTLFLVDSVGQSAWISYEPENPGCMDVANGYESLRYGHIMMLNMVESMNNPFVIGIPTECEVRPYECFCDSPELPGGLFENCSSFITWPNTPRGQTIKANVLFPIGHMIHWRQYEVQAPDREANIPGILSNVYLHGWGHDTTSASELIRLGNSWYNAPSITMIDTSAFKGGNYEKTERAYKFQRVTGEKTNLSFTINADSASPVYNPAFVIDGWGTDSTELFLNGSPFNGQYEVGFEGNNLVVWMEHHDSTDLDIKLSTPGGDPLHHISTALNNENYGSIKMIPAGAYYNTGDTVLIVARPAIGFGFTGWTGDLNEDSTAQSLIVDADISITAHFKRLTQFTLSTSAMGDGSGDIIVQPLNTVFDSATVVKVTASPSDGSAFSFWNGDLSGTSKSDMLIMDRDKSITASFEKVNTSSDKYKKAPQKQQLNIYPNPANGDEIAIELNGTAGIAEIEVIDVKGSIIIKKTGIIECGESFPLSINMLGKGVYVVLVKLDEYVLNEQLVIN